MTHDQPDSEIPAEELAALEAMANLSDEALWATAREQMPADIQARMSVLMTKNNFGTITQYHRQIKQRNGQGGQDECRWRQ